MPPTSVVNTNAERSIRKGFLNSLFLSFKIFLSFITLSLLKSGKLYNIRYPLCIVLKVDSFRHYTSSFSRTKEC